MPKRSAPAAMASSRTVSPLRIVSIGGGTGLSTLLSGLKKYAPPLTSLPTVGLPLVDITAIVTVSDDGGSSGRLRRDFDILPPGDIRNCMAALSEDEPLLSQLFRFRFSSGRGLKGHSFGNLFLAAMHHITGDFARAVRLSSEILAIRGHIFPATSANVTLEATLSDQTVVRGETRISKSKQSIERVQLKPRYCAPLPETLDAIRQADLITLGPGSLYTSVIPNLLVDGIPQAIQQSPALKIYFVNLMWQPGETMSMSASQHIHAIQQHAELPLLDGVVLNTAPIARNLLRRYARARVQPVESDLEEIEQLGVKIFAEDLLGERPFERVRHDPDALARVAIDLAKRSRAQRQRKKSGTSRVDNKEK